MQNLNEYQETEKLMPVDCVLEYVAEPDEKQYAGILDFLQKKFPGRELNVIRRENKDLGSGFILRAGNEEYDWSTGGREAQLKKKIESLDIHGAQSLLEQREIIGILRDGMQMVDFAGNEVGTVESVGDGIVYINGADHAMYGEIIVFENGQKAMVQDVRSDGIGCILLGSETEIEEGTKAIRSERMAGIPVGDAFIGRVVNALGEPIDGKGKIDAEDYRPIEQPAPGIVERQSVDTPLETGILAIDSMFPIGRGQRELIIGDRQTGKTSIAVDTILNQKGKNVICVYVAIGQKASTVSRLVNTLEKHGAMEYSIVVSATASEPAPLQYIAPYSGTALAEFFMHRGQDVLIVYDDLSKHAVAYRALSLLLERSPGREAYPGDVFYLHSRLLERSSRLSDALGGGSITALPIIETQAGDVSAYIPTNVISITDGQIFLESELFFTGQRPAINVGISVSRVGGNAQIKAMKQVSGKLKLELAQYRELASFSQFGSDIDKDTKARLDHGKVLMEILKQRQYHPMDVVDEIISIYAASHRYMENIPTESLAAFEEELLDFIHANYPEIGEKIRQNGSLDEDAEKLLVAGITRLKEAKYHG